VTPFQTACCKPHANTLLVTGEPEGVLFRADQGYGLGDQGTARINATLLSLVRNEEIDGMVQAMQDLERTWNSKFNYPWTFFNDVEFTEEFKRRTQAETKAECRYGGTSC
jgi:mannosyltransferase